jgi:hypothetical protein
METVASGTATLVDGVEQTLATIAAPGTYIVVWDLFNGVDGSLKVDLYNKITSGGASEVMFTNTAATLGSYDFSNLMSDALIVNHQLVVKALTTGNTAPVDIPWKVVKIANVGAAVEGTTSIVSGLGGTHDIVISTPGMYVFQVDRGWAYAGGDTFGYWDAMTLPSAGSYAIHGIFANPFTDTPYAQAGPFLVDGGDTITISNTTGETIDCQWSVTRVN